MRIAFDGREFVRGRVTGIARFMTGLVEALSGDEAVEEIILSVTHGDNVPKTLKRLKPVTLKTVPGSFMGAEITLSRLTKTGIDCFISPYPKLPLFRTHCPSIHTIHDVLDLTHSAYRRRYRIYWDTYRLKKALATADLTWYDSTYSQQETEKLIGASGRNPRVRHLGLDRRFSPEPSQTDDAVLTEYGLSPGYVLVIGNGLPHKNLGRLLHISGSLTRKLVFAGVSKEHQVFWGSMYPEADAVWLSHVQDDDLPVILRKAFCLAQPSTAEGYGYPPLEAMACGVPAVISDIPVLVETTGGCALRADPSDSGSWLQLIHHLEENAFYGAQVEKGLSWIRPLQGAGGWERHVADMKELLQVT